MDSAAPQLELLDAMSSGDRDAKPENVIDPRTIPTRFSLLKTMALSPAHYLEAAQHDQDEDDSLAGRLAAFASDRKEAFRIGNAIDVMLTGRAKVIVYNGRRDPRAKAWQDFQAEAAANGVAEILIASEMSVVEPVVAALRARKDAMRLLFDDTLVQQRIDWRWMGKAVRSTPDARKPGAYVVDLKSAQSADPTMFARQARRLYYHAQAELYGNAMVANGERAPGEFYVVAVEKTRPHPVTIFRFTPDLLELGAKLNRLWMERLVQCEAANVWPVYAPEPAVVDLDVEPDFGGGFAIEIDGKRVEV